MLTGNYDAQRVLEIVRSKKSSLAKLLKWTYIHVNFTAS